MTELEKFKVLVGRVSYCPETGELRWLPKPGVNPCEKRFNARFAGKPISSLNGNGYVQVHFRLNGETFHVVGHRLAWFLGTGHPPKHLIDHVDGNKTNNSISNLRDVPQRINMRNARMRRDNSSGETGIYFSKLRQKWVAQGVTLGGKRVHIGIFDSIEKARGAIVEFRENNAYTHRHGEDLKYGSLSS